MRVLGEARLAIGVSDRPEDRAVIWDITSRSSWRLQHPRGAIQMLAASSCGAKLVTVAVSVAPDVTVFGLYGGSRHSYYVYLWDVET